MSINILEYIPEEFKNCLLVEGLLIKEVLDDRNVHPIATLVGPSIIYIYNREEVIANLKNYEI